MFIHVFTCLALSTIAAQATLTSFSTTCWPNTAYFGSGCRLYTFDTSNGVYEYVNGGLSATTWSSSALTGTSSSPFHTNPIVMDDSGTAATNTFLFAGNYENAPAAEIMVFYWGEDRYLNYLSYVAETPGGWSGFSTGFVASSQVSSMRAVTWLSGNAGDPVVKTGVWWVTPYSVNGSATIYQTIRSGGEANSWSTPTSAYANGVVEDITVSFQTDSSGFATQVYLYSDQKLYWTTSASNVANLLGTDATLYSVSGGLGGLAGGFVYGDSMRYYTKENNSPAHLIESLDGTSPNIVFSSTTPASYFPVEEEVGAAGTITCEIYQVGPTGGSGDLYVNVFSLNLAQTHVAVLMYNDVSESWAGPYTVVY